MAHPIDLSGTTSPVLTFWQRYSLGGYSDRYGHWQPDHIFVQLSQDGGFTWETLSDITGISDTWTQPRIDLSAYKAKPVLIRFYLWSSGSSGLAGGWYIDDVAIVEKDTIKTAFPFSDNFENGLANWTTSGKDWALITSDYRSANHAITDSPSGNYNNYSDRIIELAHPIDLSGTTSPVLTFWQHYSLGGYSDRYGHWQPDHIFVQLSQDGGFTWETLSDATGVSNTWTQKKIDLSSYKAKQVLIRFLLWSSGSSGLSDGWYIDDVEIKDLLPAPTATISAPEPAITRTGPVIYTVTYSGAAIITLDEADITLNKTGSADAGLIVVSGAGTTTRTITLSNITGNGTLGISIAADTASNSNGSARAAGPSATFRADNNSPILTLGPPSAALTKKGPITYTATYVGASAITLKAANITLNKTGSANGLIAVSGTGPKSRTITISGITGDGTLDISIAAGSARDKVGNRAGAAGPSAPVTVDNTPPSINLGSPSPSVTSTGPVTYTISYENAAIISLSNADVTLNRTGTADASTVEVGSGPDPNSRTVTISGISGKGTLGISIAAGTAIDPVGNSAGPVGPSDASKVEQLLPPARPIATLPTGLIKTQPAYSWQAVAGADSYVLSVKTSVGVLWAQRYTAAEVGCPSGIGVCSVTPSAALAHGFYSWMVQASNASGSGPWSKSLDFAYEEDPEPEAPTAVSPAGTLPAAPTLYTWEAVSGADSYVIWIGTPTGVIASQRYSAAEAGCQAGIGTCSATSAISLPPGAYFWKVQGTNFAGSGLWSKNKPFRY